MRKATFLACVLVLVVFASSIASSTVAATKYRVTDLGSLPGGDDGNTVRGINSVGQVVGVSSTAAGSSAFVWDAANGMRDLGDLPGGEHSSTALAINAAGTVVGNGVADDNRMHAFMWSPQTGMEDIHTLIGGLPGGWSEALDINDAGQVVGRKSNLSEGGGWHGFIWDPANGVRDIGDAASGLVRSTATDINSAGQVIGGTSYGGAFVWDQVNGIRHGLLPGSPLGINANGHVVGRTEPNYPLRGYQWDAANGTRVLAASPEFPGLDSGAVDINSAGLIVGWGRRQAVIWETPDGEMKLLRELLDVSEFDWRLGEAVAINDAGQILVRAEYIGAGAADPRGFLLTPVPEPATWMFAGIGVLAIASWRRRKSRALSRGRTKKRLWGFEAAETRTLLACTVVDENWVDGGGGCKDANSQLVWSLSGVETTGSNFTQAGAKQFANNLVQGGFSDWRLPTKAELEEAAGHGLRNHANFGNGHFWTSTSSGNKRFWAVMLRTGQPLDLSKSSVIGAVAVRGVRAPVVHSTPNIRVYSTQIVNSEPAGMAAFTVALDTPPTANVTIPMTSTDATEGLPSVNSITFTPQNWNVPQFVRVNAVDDAIADGPQTFAIRLGPATSTDPNYHNLTAEEVTVLNLDDEPPPAAGAAVANASRDEPRGPSLGAARRSVEPLSQAAVDRHMAETPVIQARRTAARGVARTWRLVGSQIDEQNL